MPVRVPGSIPVGIFDAPADAAHAVPVDVFHAAPVADPAAGDVTGPVAFDQEDLTSAPRFLGRRGRGA